MLRWPYQLLIIFALGFLVYGPSLGYNFVYDDDQFIIQNPLIKSLDHFFQSPQRLPLTRLLGQYTFALNYAWGGLNPWGYHLFNLCLHLLVTILVWMLSFKLLNLSSSKGNSNHNIQATSFLIALIYFVYPTQIQAVTYISQRFESLATFFYLLSLVTYLWARTTHNAFMRVLGFFMCGLSALLGLFSKETIASLPLMILALEWIFFKQDIRKINKWAFLIGLIAFFFLFKVLVRVGWGVFQFQTPSESHEGDIITLGTYFLTQFNVFYRFLQLLVVPINQKVEYDFALSHDLFHPITTLGGLLLILLMVVGILKLRKSHPIVAFSLAWVLISFSVNFAPRANVIFEHKLYLISIGFLLGVTYSIFQNIKNLNVILVVMISWIILMTWLSIERNKVWRDDLSLWQHEILITPSKTRIYLNLSKGQLSEQRMREAIVWLDEQISRDAYRYGLWIARGGLKFRIGDIQGSIEDIKQAIHLKENFIDYYKLFLLYKAQGDNQQALMALDESLRIKPDFYQAIKDKKALLRKNL